MSSRRPLGAAALALAAAATLASAAGCRRKERALPPDTQGAQAAEPAAPVDRTLPGELAEGTDIAFGLPLPRHMIVRGRFPEAVFASGSLPSERVANYFRQRVTAERVETGPAKTVFSRARVLKGELSDRVVTIEVIARGGDTLLTVRDETPPPVKSGLTDEERWQRLGVKPDGTPIDPTTFH